MKRHTLLDLKGSSPSFINVYDGKLHDVHARDLLELNTVRSHLAADGLPHYQRHQSKLKQARAL